MDPVREGAAVPRLWVVVPAFDEEARIAGVLGALARQRDTGFVLIVVDNASRDGTARRVREFARSGPPFAVRLVAEARPGAGSAADTGFRYAVAAGARWLARTDADCVPAPDWTARVRARLAGGAEMVCGRSVPRRDEPGGLLRTRLVPAAARAAALYGRWRPEHRDPRFRAPYVLCHGHNIAITAELYVRCGGTVREPLSAGSEDVTLLNRARRHSGRVERAEEMVVFASQRRLLARGARRTLLWHWDRRFRPADEAGVHVR